MYVATLFAIKRNNKGYKGCEIQSLFLKFRVNL